MNISRLFQYKCIRKQIWPWRKKGQGQPRFIICVNLVGLTFHMLNTKSQGHWSFGPIEEDIYRVFTLYGHCGHLGHVAINICYQFNPLNSKESPYEFEFNWLNDF